MYKVGAELHTDTAVLAKTIVDRERVHQIGQTPQGYGVVELTTRCKQNAKK